MIIAFTGAGISKASGIPTFADQGDLRTKLDRIYSRQHPEEFNEIINNMYNTCKNANPNDAHKALAEYDIPVITMNVDNLHQRAGSKNVLAIHGNLPNVVLYGDPAPLYQSALDWIFRMQPGDTLLIVGVSFYTNISEQIRICAKAQGANIVLINRNAEEFVRGYLENHKDRMELFESFMNREMSF